MTKKMVMALAFSILAAGGAFAQTDFETMAKNTVTVDIGPTIAGAFLSRAPGNVKGGLTSYAFGIAAQYERQLFDKFSVAGRFAYLIDALEMGEYYIGQKGVEEFTTLDIDIYSFSIEGHARYYPWGGEGGLIDGLFAAGMLGFAYMSVDYSGEMIGRINSKSDDFSLDGINASQGYLKLGLKVGWRINFTKNGGFTFEPAIGYSFGISGDSIGQQLIKKIEKKEDVHIRDEDDFKKRYDQIENIYFVGGPRVVLAFGWRF
jgi:hypothetical protein